jgi:hypothetical protein
MQPLQGKIDFLAFTQGGGLLAKGSFILTLGFAILPLWGMKNFTRNFFNSPTITYLWDRSFIAP